LEEVTGTPGSPAQLPAFSKTHQEFPNLIIHAGKETTLAKTAIFTGKAFFIYGGGKEITHVNIMTLALQQFVHSRDNYWRILSDPHPLDVEGVVLPRFLELHLLL
jgi:hypothetical protein